MKFICSKQLLMENINIVKSAISSNSTNLILQGIYIEAVLETNNLIFIGSDSEIGIESNVQAEVLTSGSIVLNARLFSEIIRNFPDADVTFELKDNNMISLICESSYFEIRGNDSDVYPALPVVEPEKTAKISQRILKEMVQRTIFAVSTNDSRRILTGSLIECKDQEITVVSLDSKKMAVRKNFLENSTNLSVVVPGKTLKEIGKILDSEDNEVSIFTSNNQILFNLGNIKITSALLEGEFFNYSSIISKDYETRIKIDTKMLYDAVKQSASLGTDSDHKYPVTIEVFDDYIKVNSNSNIGIGEVEIEAETEGKQISTAFNPIYIMETLNAISDEKVYLNFVTELGPCIINPIEGKDFIYLIASVRI